jgi:hypothetical protein
MYSYKLIFIILLIIIIYFNNKIKENLDIMSGESINNIYTTYLNKKISFKNINNTIIFNKNNNLEILTKINIKNKFMLADTDIRYYLHGCTLFDTTQNDNEVLSSNHYKKLDLHLGYYHFTNLQLPDSSIIYAKIIIVYSGFGVYVWGETNQTINIENRGSKPLRISLSTGSTIENNFIEHADFNIIPTNELYNTDQSTFKITKTTFENMSYPKKIIAINVYNLYE